MRRPSTGVLSRAALALVMSCAASGVLALLPADHAAADSGSMFGRAYNQGYFNNETETCEDHAQTECDFLSPNGETATNVTDFINDYTSRLDSSDAQKSIGAAYTIATMLKPGGPPISLSDVSSASSPAVAAWELRVKEIVNNSLPDSSCGVNWNTSFTYNQNTAYNPGSADGGNGPDVFAYASSGPPDYNSIVFTCTKTKSDGYNFTYAIKRNCGNVVGDGNPGRGIPSWQLSGTDEATNNSGQNIADGTVGKNQTVHFNHEISSFDGINVSTLTYDWYLQGCTTASSSGCGPNSSSWANGNLTTGTATNCPIGHTCPDFAGGKAAHSYTFATSKAKGTYYCERIAFRDSDGPNNNDIGYSAGDCVQYEPNGSGGGGGGGSSGGCTGTCIGKGSAPSGDFSCTDATSMSIGKSNYADPSTPKTLDTSLKYALYFVSSGGTAPAWTAGQTYSNTSSSKSDFPDPGSGSAQTTTSPIDNGSSLPDYTVPVNQLASGTVTWYLITFNNSTQFAYFDSDHNPYYTDSTYIDYVTPAAVDSCFQATCTFTVAGTLGGTDTEATKSFGYSITVQNSGSNDLTDPLGASPIDVTPSYVSGSTPSAADVGGTLSSGDYSDALAFSSTAPHDTSTHVLSATIGYPGLSNLSNIGSCQGPTMSDYEYFTLEPTAVICTIACDIEDPTSVNYDAYVISTDPETTVSVPAPTTSSVYKVPVGSTTASNYYAGPNSDSGPFASSDNPPPSGSGNYTLAPSTFTPPSPYNAGDKYCTEVTFTDYNEGYIGPDDDLIGKVIDNSLDSGYPDVNGARDCFIVTNRPYVHFFGAGALATVKGFGDSCTALPNDTSGGIYTFNKINGSSYSGSGTQFGAQALGIVEGFGSAMLHSNPGPPGGLTFANANTGLSAPDYGGKIGTAGDCLPDYYNGSTGLTATTPGSVTVGSSSVSGATLYNGPLTINTNGQIPEGVHQTIYVNGDVYLNGSIAYAGTTSWSSIADIPSFDLVASGNIYIAPNVSQLDGFYVAQPEVNPNNQTIAGGTIDSCAQNNPTDYTYTASQLYENCGTQLTVNGAFTADTVLLDRSYGSLRNSAVSENSTTTPHACSSYTGSPATAPDCAAEIFNFSPELLLAPQSLPPTTGPTTGTYDKITSLSPILHSGQH